MRRTLLICALTVTLASAAGCGGGDAKGDDGGAGGKASASSTARAGNGAAHDVVLEVLGKGRANGILYHGDGNGSESGVALPWKKAQRVPGGLLVAVLANAPLHAKVTCRITVDGTVVAQKTGEVAQCRHTLPK